MEENSGIGDMELLRRHIGSGNADAWNEVLMKYRERLRRMVSLRIHPRLQGRVDASDIVQEAFIEAHRSLGQYVNQPAIPVHVWLRRLAGQKLIQAHRTHIDAQKRSTQREKPQGVDFPSASSQSLVAELMATTTSPSQAAVHQETKAGLLAALESMDEVDREVLTLRHFEYLTSQETAEILGMSNEAIKKRYVRALEKLHRILIAGGIHGP